MNWLINPDAKPVREQLYRLMKMQEARTLTDFAASKAIGDEISRLLNQIKNSMTAEEQSELNNAFLVATRMTQQLPAAVSYNFTFPAIKWRIKHEFKDSRIGYQR